MSFMMSLVLDVCFVALPIIAMAEDDREEEVETSHSDPEAKAEDNTGTNPLLFKRQITVFDEYQFQPSDTYVNITNFRYFQPFNSDTMNLRYTIPFVMQDTPFSESGLGDIKVRFNSTPYVDKKMGLVASLELSIPTASAETLGSEKWVIAPGLTWVNFLTSTFLIAPAYFQNISFAGDDNRSDVNRGDFDLYAVYRPKDKPWWITTDFAVVFDFENDTTPISFECALSHYLTKMPWGGALSGYIRPGVGFGDDKPYDANIEVGVSAVGF